jgi:hypothetical protein
MSQVEWLAVLDPGDELLGLLRQVGVGEFLVGLPDLVDFVNLEPQPLHFAVALGG